MPKHLQLIVSLAIALAPELVVRVLDLSQETKHFIVGLFAGGVAGWWAYHFISSRAAANTTAEKDLVIAKTALLAEQNAEQQRQHERNRQDKADAEKADEKKKAEEERAKERAEKERKDKDILAIREKFMIGSDSNLVLRKGESPLRYCRICGFENGKAVELRRFGVNDSRWYCPECGAGMLDIFL